MLIVFMSFRGFVGDNAQLSFVTDARSEKV